MSINQRIAALRLQMKAANIDAYIIPSSDPHQSEYVAPHWKSREWISGFSGSAGTVVITHDHAGLWTDSRYYIAAEQQLAGSEVKLHKQIVQGAPEHLTWLKNTLPNNSKIGLDNALFSVEQYRSMVMSMGEVQFNPDLDLITPIWTDRPPLPVNPVFEHELKYAGRTRTQKLDAIRSEMKTLGADYHLVTTLDDIAWTLNIRSNDVECNPVTIAYMVIGNEHTHLFINPKKLDTKIHKTLQNDNIHLHEYESIEHILKSIKGNILIDDSNLNAKLYYNAIKDINFQRGNTISILLKACKNETEIAHIRQVMVKDAVALTKAFSWLESTLDAGNTPTEYEVATKIAQSRSEQSDYHGESFDAIIGYRGNGAIVHYKPEPATSLKIKKQGILLLDSGGQYTNGTTDITRTITLGTPTAEEKRDFTLVLKGHIGLANLKFPQGTTGVQMDILARQHLWAHGLNYGHGTGHGVGFFLNVHEPPQGFIPGLGIRGRTIMQLGMLTSNEPGFYKEGSHGIRIENLVIAVPAEKTPYGQFMRFDTVTLFPIDQNLIEKTLMTKPELKWLNTYHKEVYAKTAKHLNKEEKAWLKLKCKSI
jgi:Xaa-Pro aminopeptidase